MNLLNSLIPALQGRPVVRREVQTRNEDLGPVVKPHYEVSETDEAFALVVDLPGVAKDGLELTAEEGTFRVVGRRAWKRPEAWTRLYRESAEANFLLELTNDNAVDLDKIHAELKDGVLRVSLPKTEAIKPRKIAVA